MADTQMQLEDWLDDLCVRFIINLPQEDLSSVARICFQVEEAQWFYEDFIRPLDPTLPSMSLRTFCLRIFQHCPLLASFSVENHTKAFEEFLQYKTRVPVRGAIMLNQAMDSVVLVKGWKKGASWSFPRGKINKDEDDLDCAVREVYEETGLHLRAAGLVPSDKQAKYIEIAMREQQLRLYVFRNVPMDTNFIPRTRKEISKIQWYKLSELPAFRKKGAQNNNDSGAGSNTSKFYMVAPFLVPLKKWIVSQKKMDDKRAVIGVHSISVHQNLPLEEVPTTEDDTCAPICPAPPDQVPAIETLDAATKELQRLLKMQPPTQGLQARPSLEDKGSALLSILQTNGPRPEGVVQMPQTPLDLTVSEPPHPRNPHHHTNQQSVPLHTHAHEPPPVFELVLDHAVSSRNLEQKRVGHSQSISQRVPDFSQQYHQIKQQAPLAYPHRELPQVQRMMFGSNAPEEVRSGAHQAGYVHQEQLDKSRAPQDQIPPQAHDIGRPRPFQLHAHSLALLDAFKRDTAASAPLTPYPDENEKNREAAASGLPAADFSSHSEQVVSQRLANLLDNSARRGPDQKSPPELQSSVETPLQQHRSTLLDMFKRLGSDAGVIQAPDGRRHGSNGPVPAGAGAKDGTALLQQLRVRDLGVRAMSLDQPSIQHRSAQHGMPRLNDWENVAPNRLASGPARTTTKSPVPVQPTRILQRGQNLVQDSPTSSRKSSPHELQAQPRPGQVTTSPLGTNTMPPPGDLRRRPGATEDQRRQLLSLFGKQQSPLAGAVREGAGASRSRVASMALGSGERPPLDTRPSTSSRRSTQTPISPAEQTFLLEYLQTVTNNAS